MEWGDKRMVVRGPFKGFVATVREVDGEQVECEVNIFGRATTVTLTPADLGAVAMSDAEIAGIEEEVARAARWSAPHAYDRMAWLVARNREGVADTDLQRLDREMRDLDARIDEADRPLVEAALAKFRAAFAQVPVADRAAWWQVNRETYVSPSDRRRVTDPLGLDPDDDDAVRAVMEPANALRVRIEASRHAGFTDDLEGTRAIAGNADLEAAIDAAPEDDALRVVYGDWLQGHADPRGELIAAMDNTAEGTRRADRLLAEHERYLLGGLPRYPDVVTLTWRRGYLEGAKVMTHRKDEEAGVSQAALVRTLMKLPSSRFLSALTLGCASVHEDGVAAAVIDALVDGGGRPSMRSLVLDTDGEEEMLSWTETGALDRVWPLFPNVTSLEIVAGNLDFTELPLPKLQRLRIETCHLGTAQIGAIAAADFQALTALELWFGSENFLGAAISLVESLPPLVELGLANAVFTDELVDALVGSTKLATVERLDLSHGTLTDAGAAVLARAIGERRFPRLKVVEANQSYLTEDGLATLRATGVSVRSDWQRDRESDQDRYCAVWE